MALFGSKATGTQLLRLFEEKCSAGMFTVAQEGDRHIFLSATQRFREHFDLPAAGIDGRPVDEFMGGETGADFRRCLDETMMKRRRLVRRVALQRVDGADWFLLHLDPELEIGPGEPRIVYGL